MEPTTINASPIQAGTSAITERVWFNAIWFQITWFCTVIGRDALLPAAIALIALHLFLVADKKRELKQLAAVGLAGAIVDASLSITGVFEFSNGALVPLWLICLWLAFATTLGRSLAFLGKRLPLAALVGGIMVPFNYWAGHRLGAVDFGYSLPVTLAVMGVIWAILLPSLYRLTHLLNRDHTGVTP
tara:strand:+ start:6910 stop:7470 length:561 start_codon:yes stop_codon:yes gene_type:complete